MLDVNLHPSDDFVSLKEKEKKKDRVFVLVIPQDVSL